MKGKAKRAAGLLLVLLGTFLIAAALTLVFYNILDGNRAEKASQEILVKMDQLKNGNDGDGENLPEGETEAETGIPAEERRKGFSLLDMVMPMVNIDGYNYIGTLVMPSLGLRLPVMASWDYDRLKISPCRYSGSYYTDDLVICAHNYKSHFGPLRWVKFDSDVYLTDVDGNVHHYKVDNIETLPPTDIEEMITSETEDGNSMWDLTLFTCTPGGASRMAVRCVRVLDY